MDCGTVHTHCILSCFGDKQIFPGRLLGWGCRKLVSGPCVFWQFAFEGCHGSIAGAGRAAFRRKNNAAFLAKICYCFWNCPCSPVSLSFLYRCSSPVCILFFMAFYPRIYLEAKGAVWYVYAFVAGIDPVVFGVWLLCP